MENKSKRHSLLIQMVQRVRPHQEHPELKDKIEVVTIDTTRKNTKMKIWNDLRRYCDSLPAHQACQSHQ